MALTPAAATTEKTVRGILLLLQQLLREKAHAQLTIHVRDGKIVLTTEQRTRRPENLPEP